MNIKKVGVLTSGGLAPCLTPAVAFLVKYWNQINPAIEVVGYRNGYAGLLTGTRRNLNLTDTQIQQCLDLGGSILGNSRVKLANQDSCVKDGLILPNEDPFEVAAGRIENDNLDVLFVVGGDDTALTATDLAAHLTTHNIDIPLVGLPKTIDNDINPIALTLGASSAATHGAQHAIHLTAEHTATPKSIIVHEVMGRNSGWLTLATAHNYWNTVGSTHHIPGATQIEDWMIDVVITPEMTFNLDGLANQLEKIWASKKHLNIFIAEGAGLQEMIKVNAAEGKEIEVDAYGHPRLDKINAGQWLASHLKKRLGAQKIQVGKSGYFARSGPATPEDLQLIEETVRVATEIITTSGSVTPQGVVGLNTLNGNNLELIPFTKISGGKTVNLNSEWAQEILDVSSVKHFST